MRGQRRVLCYALGGGLGHLRRIDRFLRQHLPSHHAIILTTSGLAAAIESTSPHPYVRVPATLESDRAALRDWLAGRIADADADLILVDVFPCGLLGELLDFPWPADVPRWHLARLLRWDRYCDDVRSVTGADLATTAPSDLPTYDRCLVLEALHEPHQEFLSRISKKQDALDLFTEDSGRAADAAARSDSWLVVHSGPVDEVHELVNYAIDVQRLEGVIAPIRVATLAPLEVLPERCVLIAEPFPASAHLATAARIVTAAGFNLIHETRAFRDRQLILPLPRRYDDQFERAKRARRL